MFTGRTDAEAEAPILWPPDVKNRLIGKDPDAGRKCGQENGASIVGPWKKNEALYRIGFLFTFLPSSG